MKNDTHYLIGEVEKCKYCNGRGYTQSENHPDCPICSGSGHVKIEEHEDENMD